jgi:hypothetical protein
MFNQTSAFPSLPSAARALWENFEVASTMGRKQAVP